MVDTEQPRQTQRPDDEKQAARVHRSPWKRLAVSLVTLILALPVAEFVSRFLISDEDLNVIRYSTMTFHVNDGYELIPNTEEDGVRINSTGHRDREIQAVNTATRILMLGDSIVFGPGVAQEDTFPKQAEEFLTAECINGGNPDTGIREQIRIFKKRDLPLSPDIVLCCFYMNDSRPPAGFRSEFVKGNPIVRFTKRFPWTRRSMVYSMLYRFYFSWAIADEASRLPVSRRMEWLEIFQQENWRGDPDTLQDLIDAAQYDWGAAWKPETWPEVESQLNQLNQLCTHHNIRPALVAIPVSVQVNAETERREPQEELKNIADEMNWPFLDLLDGLKRANEGEDLFIDQCHLTVRGHRVVAKQVAEFVKKQGWDGGVE